jgi:phosphatidylglycerophosphate synthase
VSPFRAETCWPGFVRKPSGPAFSACVELPPALLQVSVLFDGEAAAAGSRADELIVPLRSFVRRNIAIFELMIAMALSWKDFWTRHGYPALYVPQLLGYARIALALHAFAVAMVRPSQTVSLYALSFVCDELDGRFARMLGQSTQFGALLDMVTDRVATTGLAAIVYARAVAVLDADTVCPVALVLFSLVALDIFSHWMHMTSVHAGHGIKTSHKETRSSQPVGSRALAHRHPLSAIRSPPAARRSPPPPRFAACSVVDPAVL